MTEHEASRTLVKSPPELWAECSDPASLARHLNGSFGEIRITRLEPETAVAWEGEHASGTVKLEASGWGTKVIITARAHGDESPVESATPETIGRGAGVRLVGRARPVPTARAARPTGFLARLRRLLRPQPAAPESVPALEPVPAPERTPDPEPQAEVWSAPGGPPPPGAEVPQPSDAPATPEVTQDARDALTSALDSLGQAHHRPFSRA